jgi:hypothetical protein
MSVRTFEGIIEKGQVKLNTPVNLPERTKVYVIVPDAEVAQTTHVRSPRLARPEQAADFQMEVIENPPDAGLR